MRIFRDTRAVLAESPFWYGGALHWTDIPGGLLHVSPADGAVDGSDDRVIEVTPPLASFAPAEGGGWVLGLGDRVVLLGDDGREVRELARIRHPHAGMRLNEGKCDPTGRFVVGSMNMTTGAADGAWYRVGDDGATVLFGGFAISNGLEWSLDERTVYVTDTPAKTIYRAPWNPDGGPQELESFSTGAPSDGLVIDADGCFWNARYGQSCVARLDPDGREIGRVDLPAPNVTGLAFGGDDLSTLYIGTARENLDEAALRRWPHSGSVFAVDTATHGVPVRTYGPR